MGHGVGKLAQLSSPQPLKADRRKARRTLRVGEATLVWIRESQVHTVSVHVKDTSGGGVGLVSPEPVPIDHTALVASGDGTGSWGIVRRCTRSKSNYHVGLELVSETTQVIR